MLCFDVRIDKDAQAYADEVGVKIFTARIIYHLEEAFRTYQKEMLEKKKEETKLHAVFPCVLNPVQVFHATNPIVVGVDVIEGSLRIGTPICALKIDPNTKQKTVVNCGRVATIELNHRNVDVCKKGQPSVAVKIQGTASQPSYGRQLEDKDVLYSLIDRRSIDTLKEFYRDEVSKDDWKLIQQLKGVLGVV